MRIPFLTFISRLKQRPWVRWLTCLLYGHRRKYVAIKDLHGFGECRSLSCEVTSAPTCQDSRWACDRCGAMGTKRMHKRWKRGWMKIEHGNLVPDLKRWADFEKDKPRSIWW
jgi:hypothetical protein